MEKAQEVVFCFPTTDHPFYHLKVAFALGGEIRYQIKKTTVNGQRVRDFFAYNNFILEKDNIVWSGGLNEVVARWDWKAGEEAAVELTGEGAEAKDLWTLKARAQAPQYGGYWNSNWKHYASIVCTETAGFDRADEPVHCSLALYSDRIRNPEAELRIVAVDPLSGLHREVESQVFEVNRYAAEGVKIGEEYQPTTTFQAAFYADVPAYTSRVYLAFYGNPNAERPGYPSRLTVQGEGLGLAVENPYYKTLLARTSGSIDEIHMKLGVNRAFYHHLETNGALHWNPGIYSPPRAWLHASDWNPPESYSWMSGPVFAATRRCGPLDGYPEFIVSITYRFYERTPWIHMSSRVEVKKDVPVKALRNGEVVLDRKLVEEFAWRKPGPGGAVGTMVITDGPRHPRHAKVLPADTPWACLFNREHGCGLGLVTAKLAESRVDGGLVKTYGRYSYLQWGPWVYYCRPLVYTFASNNSARLVVVPAGNSYYEEMAFVPIRVRPVGEDFGELELLYQKLSHPLDVQVVEDTDPRAPQGWVAPVLVQEFEEMAD